MNRRELLEAGVGVALATALSPRALLAQSSAKPLRLLILGGTRFIGPHFVEAARARGHQVTLFNRGRTNPERAQNVEVLHGDRDGQLDALKGRQWDAVLDTSAFVPRIVRLSAELLAPSISQYVFVSSISVYASFARPNDESSPLGKIADETIEKVDGDTYGPLKALCERAAERALPGRTTILRPGLIVGPDDNTDRFTYWPARVARGGEVMAPGTREDEIQVIDVRDLAAFTLLGIEQRIMGAFNLISPPDTFTMGGLLDACVAAARSDARVTWVPAGFLAAHKVEGWSDMPVWVNAVGEEAGFALTSAERALTAGLKIRPLSDTVRDTLAWHLSRPAEQQAKLKAGITPEREQEVLAAWHASQPQDPSPAPSPQDGERASF
ncbi:MAG TPA: SDR family oxidoreductase [Steroidobacteraceae bacterium]